MFYYFNHVEMIDFNATHYECGPNRNREFLSRE